MSISTDISISVENEDLVLEINIDFVFSEKKNRHFPFGGAKITVPKLTFENWNF